MQSVFAGAKAAGWTQGRNARIDHVGFGVVLGEDGYVMDRRVTEIFNEKIVVLCWFSKKLKSRSGETIRLRDLLDEGLERSKKKLHDKGRDTVKNT